MTNQQNQPKKSQKRKNLLSKYKILAIIIAAFVFLPSVSSAQFTESSTSTSSSTLPNATFIAPEVEAISAAIYDINSGTFIYTKNADEVRALASLTKILTAITTRDFVISQKIPTKVVSLKKIIPETKIDRELKVGEKWNIEELLRFMLTTSSNTAADSIGSQIIPTSSFLSLMNFKAKSLGLKTISVYNTTGLPLKTIIKRKIVETPGAYGSAKEVALLAAEMQKSYPDLLKYTSNYRDTFTSTVNGKKTIRVATSTNELLGKVPNILGGKTGFTQIAGGNLAVVVDAAYERPVVIVVMGSSVQGRFKDITALASSTADFFTVI